MIIYLGEQVGLGFQPHAKQEYVQKIEAVTFPAETDVNQSLNLLLDDVSVAHVLESWSTTLSSHCNITGDT